MIFLELNARTARVRRFANGGALVFFAASGEALFLDRIASEKFDLSRASRLSRGAAHRLVDALTDANVELKQTYHRLIDEEAIYA